jgi:hypothetical protein
MQWELAKRADLEMCIPVTQRLRLNPYAYWVADITVVLYRVRQADSIPLDSPVATPRPHPHFRGA